MELNRTRKPESAKFPANSLLAGNCRLETGSYLTAHTATRRRSWPRRRDQGELNPPSLLKAGGYYAPLVERQSRGLIVNDVDPSARYDQRIIPTIRPRSPRDSG